MHTNKDSLVKALMIEYAKAHDEYAGKILDAADKIEEGIKILRDLPIEIQKELQQYILSYFIAQIFKYHPH